MVGIVVAAVAVVRPERPVAVPDVSSPAVASAVKVGTVRTAEAAVLRWKRVAAVVGIVPAAGLRRPNVAEGVPSSWEQFAGPEKSAPASVATAVASRAEAADGRPLTSEAEAAEGCSPVGSPRRAVGERAVVGDGSSMGLAWTVAVAVVAVGRPFRDA